MRVHKLIRVVAGWQRAEQLLAAGAAAAAALAVVVVESLPQAFGGDLTIVAAIHARTYCHRRTECGAHFCCCCCCCR